MSEVAASGLPNNGILSERMPSKMADMAASGLSAYTWGEPVLAASGAPAAAHRPGSEATAWMGRQGGAARMAPTAVHTKKALTRHVIFGRRHHNNGLNEKRLRTPERFCKLLKDRSVEIEQCARKRNSPQSKGQSRYTQIPANEFKRLDATAQEDFAGCLQ